MLGDARAVAFAPTADLDRARAFYEGVLGLTVEGREPSALVLSAGGVRIRIIQPETFMPSPATVLGFEVEDIHAVVRALSARGVITERYSFNAQDTGGVWNAPSGDKVAWLKDPDGNILSLTQPAKA